MSRSALQPERASFIFDDFFQYKVPRPVVCLLGWFLAVGLGLSSVYGVYTVYKEGGRPFNTAENIIYGTFSRFVWGLALAWVIYACNKGYGSKFVSYVLNICPLQLIRCSRKVREPVEHLS